MRCERSADEGYTDIPSMERCMRLSPLRTSLLLAALLGVATQANAAVIMLDDFESGLGAWTTSGGVSLDGGASGVGPIQGSSQVLLTTGAGAVDTSTLESAMGMTPNTVQRAFRRLVRNPGESVGDDPIEGSALQITFSAVAGDAIEFDWDLLTNELSGTRDPALYTDFAFLFLEEPSAQSMNIIGHVNQPGLVFNPLGGSYADDTGVQTINVPLTKTGTYTMTIGVFDLTDTLMDTGLIFDNFRLVKSPEPGTASLLAAGLLGLAWRARRLRPRPDPD
jgi:hypothetical protein